ESGVDALPHLEMLRDDGDDAVGGNADEIIWREGGCACRRACARGSVEIARCCFVRERSPRTGDRESELRARLQHVPPAHVRNDVPNAHGRHGSNSDGGGVTLERPGPRDKRAVRVTIPWFGPTPLGTPDRSHPLGSRFSRNSATSRHAGLLVTSMATRANFAGVPRCSASRTLRSAPAATSIFAIRRSPSHAAECSAVPPLPPSFAFTFAPCASSHSTSS